MPAYYLLLLLLLIFFIPTQNVLVGLLAGLLMLFIIVYEFYTGVKEGGWKNELIQTGLAVLVAVMVWFGSGFLLNTPTPINAIVSCSMRPAYERGDLVLLMGGVSKTPVFSYAGRSTDINATAVVSDGNSNFAVLGSWLAYCSSHISDDARCSAFVKAPSSYSETHGPLFLQYGPCVRQAAGSNQPLMTTICVTQTKFNGQTVPFDASDDLIVYTPKATDLYGRVGDIVHRVRLGINASDGLVYLTKGDNNPVYDLQAYDENARVGNSPISPNQVKGHVWLRIPFIGNLKLFITPAVLANPSSLSGCDSHFEANSR